ncbi:25752_t:CDS:2, partial [Dentiscutata erythropus]
IESLIMILIGIIGPTCSGKDTITKWLGTKGFMATSLSENVSEDYNLSELISGVGKIFENMPKQITYESENKNTLKIYQTNIKMRQNLLELNDSPEKKLLQKIIDGKLSVRYDRWKQKCSVETAKMKNEENGENNKKGDGGNYENFDTVIKANDKNWDDIYELMSMADLTITNNYSTEEDLHNCLKKLDLSNLKRLRPTYDTYFMYLAELVTLRTNCVKRKVGCVLVKDSRIIATGYNGIAKGLNNCIEGECQSCTQDKAGGKSDHCLCVHAEVNALLEVGRE